MSSPDVSAIVAKVTEQVALDVYNELKRDIAQAHDRWSQTSYGKRHTGRRGEHSIQRVVRTSRGPAALRAHGAQGIESLPTALSLRQVV